MSADIFEIIETALEMAPSDLHISVGVPPICRVNSRLVQLNYAPQTVEQNIQNIQKVLSSSQWSTLQEQGEIDIAFTYAPNPDMRMRLNIYRQRGSYCMAFRILKNQVPDFESLGLNPQIMTSFCQMKHGLVLVTGATGTGKTTTITAMIDWINKNRSAHIMTIEDPIEYFHRHRQSIVHQREIGSDTKDYSSGLRAVLRQDPDIIFIGEMRDLESISTAITAAETGHLVFSTLHTLSASKTIDRIIDVFPSNQQQQIRTQLSMVLNGIVSQQLVPSFDESKQVLATETMLMTPAISNLIRENKVSQIHNSMLTGGALGMQTMDNCLSDLARSGKIKWETAKAYSIYPDTMMSENTFMGDFNGF